MFTERETEKGSRDDLRSAGPPILEARAVGHGYRGPRRFRLFGAAKPERQERLEVISSIDLTVNAGDFVSLVGPSGCGKTTLLRILAGLIVPDYGAVYDCGVHVTAPDYRRSLVFQQPHLFPWLTVEQNIAFGPRNRGVPPKLYRPVVERLLRLVRLEQFRSALPQQLSGGMRQRVSLARGLANEPHILLLDEPLGALDALTRERMQDELRAIWKQTGCTIVLVTHSVEEALYLSTRVIVLSVRPTRIVTELPVEFSSNGHSASGRSVKASKEFLDLRERVIEEIWTE
ncbi:MAG: ABC transporter ATP-binding protein [Spirochaetaceae bacterium]|nr:MAG: ABC transporter ATP-binding protein [Spirochaetaceae bacterium]